MDEPEKEHIKGQRDLSAEEIRAINRIKDLEREVAKAVTELDLIAVNHIDNVNLARSLGLARLFLQTGFMHLTHSIAQPEGGLGDITAGFLE